MSYLINKCNISKGNVTNKSDFDNKGNFSHKSSNKKEKESEFMKSCNTKIKRVIPVMSIILVPMVKSVKNRNLSNMGHEGNISYE